MGDGELVAAVGDEDGSAGVGEGGEADAAGGRGGEGAVLEDAGGVHWEAGGGGHGGSRPAGAFKPAQESWPQIHHPMSSRSTRSHLALSGGPRSFPSTPLLLQLLPWPLRLGTAHSRTDGPGHRTRSPREHLGSRLRHRLPSIRVIARSRLIWFATSSACHDESSGFLSILVWARAAHSTLLPEKSIRDSIITDPSASMTKHCLQTAPSPSPLWRAP